MPDEIIIPGDFPREAPLASLAGVQPKIPLVRMPDGHFVQQQTHDELKRRFEICSDLVNQLVRYCEKKARERPEWSQDELLRKVDVSVRSKGWDVSSEELDWVMAQVRERVAGPRLGVAKGAFEVSESIDVDNGEILKLLATGKVSMADAARELGFQDIGHLLASMRERGLPLPATDPAEADRQASDGLEALKDEKGSLRTPWLRRR